MSIFQQTKLQQIIAECGDRCHYCNRETRLKWIPGQWDPDHATLDHIIPKSKGGTNARENLVLACNACNNAKGDMPYETFAADPFAFRPRRKYQPPRTAAQIASAKYNRDMAREPREHPAYKARSGTLAAAIASGHVTPYGEYQATPSTLAKLQDFPFNPTVYALTGKRVPKRSEIFERRDQKFRSLA